jgi:hypothetical protein
LDLVGQSLDLTVQILDFLDDVATARQLSHLLLVLQVCTVVYVLLNLVDGLVLCLVAIGIDDLID